jgi:biopolymer transport protein ExbD
MAGAAPQEGSAKGKKKALDAELNLVPFIDLLSCCISFLLITAVWTQISGLQVASTGSPPENLPPKETQTIDVKLELGQTGYALTMAGARIEIPKINGKDGPQYDQKTLTEKLKTLKASLPEQQVITVQPEDTVAYEDLVNAVDTAVGSNLRDVTVAPAN